jgi:hypothetical protein
MKNNSSFITHHSSFAAGATLYGQMEESAKLDEVIRKNLANLGFPKE